MIEQDQFEITESSDDEEEEDDDDSININNDQVQFEDKQKTVVIPSVGSSNVNIVSDPNAMLVPGGK